MWTLDVASGDLKFNQKQVGRNNQTETLVLACLVSNKGGLVTKDRLLDVGWPGKYVAPNSLTVAIKNIRKLFSLVKSDIYIETVHRKGYILHTNIDNIVNVSSTQNELTLEEACFDAADPVNDTKVNESAVNKIVLNHINQTNLSPDMVQNKTTVILTPQAKHLSALKIFGYFAFTFYLIFVVIIAFVTTFSRYDLHCYKVERAECCGLFALTEHQQDILKLKLKGLEGRFACGYDEKISEIKVYPVD